jgi:uncharacterized membrane protein
MSANSDNGDWWRDLSRPADDSRILGNVQRVARLEESQLQARSLSERIAGAVTRAAGTATFALTHLAWFSAWIGLNAGFVHGMKPFDPFPFSLLTMITSLEAIFLSIWILISQNQMSRQAERREHLDLQINLLAEQESTATLRIVRSIAEHLGIDPETSRPDAALVEETDIEGLATRMDETLPESPGTSASEPPRPGDMTPS